MKVLSMSDIYQVRSSHHLDIEDQRVILQLYQPLIGHESTILYLTLFSELNQLTLTKKPALISRLCKVTGFPVSSLSQALAKLEAVGLISTYVKHHDNRYLFDLKMPLSANQFMKHKILNTLLVQRLHDEYTKTAMAFQTYNVDLNQYDDVSVSFTDVFDIQLHSEQVLQEKEYRKKVHNTIEDDYDMTLFYQSMESLQLSRKMLSQDNIKLIQQLGILYKINALDMLDMVKAVGADRMLTLDVKNVPDIVPALSVACALRKGGTHIINAGRLRIKECDRLHAAAEGLNALGAKVKEGKEDMFFDGVEKLTGGVELPDYHDHRMVMTFAIAATVCEKPVLIDGAESVSKSYPAFFKDFEKLGGKYEISDKEV